MGCDCTKTDSSAVFKALIYALEIFPNTDRRKLMIILKGRLERAALLIVRILPLKIHFKKINLPPPIMAKTISNLEMLKVIAKMPHRSCR